MHARIENFQSHADTQVEIEGFTVILGPSNHGKSALVRAVAAALFNRPGDAFVRHGQDDDAVVTLTGLPSTTGPLTVSWSKGKKPAVFTVNGATYGKVGKGTPQPLLDAGYRLVELRDVSLRVQVAGQLDRLFLLHDGGGVLVDAVGEAARLDVFANAVEACAADLRAAVAAHKGARTRQEAYTVRVAALTPPARAWLDASTALAQQVEALDAQVVEVRQSQARAQARVRALAVVAPQAVPTPPVDTFTKPLHWCRVRRLVASVTAPVPLPGLPEGAATFRTALQAVRVGRRARAVFAPVAPPQAVDAISLRRQVALAQSYTRALQVPAPTPVGVNVIDSPRFIAQCAAVTAYRSRVEAVEVTRDSLLSATNAVAYANTALQTFKAAHPVCPTCGGLWTAPRG
jgi:energy-coupling factor transporter ATP-binding protein EcfA2